MDFVTLLTVIISLMTIYKEMEAKAKERGFEYDPMRDIRDLSLRRVSRLLQTMPLIKAKDIASSKEYLEEVGLGMVYDKFHKDAEKVLKKSGITEKNINKAFNAAMGKAAKLGFTNEQKEAINAVELLHTGLAGGLNMIIGRMVGSEKHCKEGSKQMSEVEDKAVKVYKTLDVEKHIKKYKGMIQGSAKFLQGFVHRGMDSMITGIKENPMEALIKLRDTTAQMKSLYHNRARSRYK